MFNFAGFGASLSNFGRTISSGLTNFKNNVVTKVQNFKLPICNKPVIPSNTAAVQSNQLVSSMSGGGGILSLNAPKKGIIQSLKDFGGGLKDKFTKWRTDRAAWKDNSGNWFNDTPKSRDPARGASFVNLDNPDNMAAGLTGNLPPPKGTVPLANPSAGGAGRIQLTATPDKPVQAPHASWTPLKSSYDQVKMENAVNETARQIQNGTIPTSIANSGGLHVAHTPPPASTSASFADKCAIGLTTASALTGLTAGVLSAVSICKEDPKFANMALIANGVNSALGAGSQMMMGNVAGGVNAINETLFQIAEVKKQEKEAKAYEAAMMEEQELQEAQQKLAIAQSELELANIENARQELVDAKADGQYRVLANMTDEDRGEISAQRIATPPINLSDTVTDEIFDQAVMTNFAQMGAEQACKVNRKPFRIHPTQDTLTDAQVAHNKEALKFYQKALEHVKLRVVGKPTFEIAWTKGFDALCDMALGTEVCLKLCEICNIDPNTYEAIKLGAQYADHVYAEYWLNVDARNHFLDLRLLHEYLDMKFLPFKEFYKFIGLVKGHLNNHSILITVNADAAKSYSYSSTKSFWNEPVPPAVVAPIHNFDSKGNVVSSNNVIISPTDGVSLLAAQDILTEQVIHADKDLNILNGFN